MTGYCECEGAQPFERIFTFEKAPLCDGRHTSFEVMRCKICNRLTGFPKTNFALWRRERATPSPWCGVPSALALAINSSCLAATERSCACNACAYNKENCGE